MNGEPDPYCDEILQGALPVEVVADTEHVLAFHHPSPSFAPVQIVVIPRLHIASIADLPLGCNDLAIELLRALADISAQVVAEHGAAQVVTNVGALQHSRHMHWHVIVDPGRRQPSATPVNESDARWRGYWIEQRWR